MAVYTAISRARGYILTKLPDTQLECPSGASPGTANSGSVFEPHVSIQGASCASRIVYLSRFKPHPGWRTKGLIRAFLFVAVARLISSHLTMEQPSQIIICDVYFFATVASEGSMKSLRHVPSSPTYGRPLIDRPTASSNLPPRWRHRICVEFL